MNKKNCYVWPLARASFSLFGKLTTRIDDLKQFAAFGSLHGHRFHFVGKRVTRIDEQKQFAMFGLLHGHRLMFFLLPSSIYSKRVCNFDQNRSRVNTFCYLGSLTHLRTDAGMGTQMHTCAHTCTHAQMLQAHAHTHTDVHVHAHAYTRSRTHMRSM